jgi:ubiquinone/menaquinone biosynthesis C-methylase UbiE
MAVFDEAAVTYDDTFSHTLIGSAMRNLSRRMLLQHLDENVRDILEINCGTGEDAIYLASKEYNVIATDASSRMIEVAQNKTGAEDVHFEKADFQMLSARFPDNSFDVVFSNFGGLNCADPEELKNTLRDISVLLRRGGKFIGVIMGTACAWEQVYYLMKFDGANAYRRHTAKGAPTTLGDQRFKTYYYSPVRVKNMAGETFEFNGAWPVGFFIPPTYLEHYFARHPKQLNLLVQLEKRVSKFSILANRADHYMIVLEKKA